MIQHNENILNLIKKVDSGKKAFAEKQFSRKKKEQGYSHSFKSLFMCCHVRDNCYQSFFFAILSASLPHPNQRAMSTIPHTILLGYFMPPVKKLIRPIAPPRRDRDPKILISVASILLSYFLKNTAVSSFLVLGIYIIEPREREGKKYVEYNFFKIVTENIKQDLDFCHYFIYSGAIIRISVSGDTMGGV